jgi:O-antigen/teichoic acid export membrane protein
MISDVVKLLRSDGFKAECARGGLTLGAGTAIERGLRFVKNIILARLLAPDQFGLMAIIVAMSAAFEAFAEVGVRQSIIHNKQGDKPEFLNAAWWLQAFRGVGLFLMAFLLTPWISRFYESPELLPLMRVSFITILLNGFISPRAYVLEKRFQFGRSVLLIQGSGLLSTLLTVGLAFYIQNVWALVIGLVAEGMAKCVFSFVLCPFRPRLSIHHESLHELLKFARGMFGMPILTLLTFRMDVIILGKMVTTEQLGLYYMALSLSQIPFEVFDRTVSPVLLPAFAKKQSDRSSVRNVVRKATNAVVLLGMPFVAVQILCARPVLALIYGPQFVPAAGAFAFLAVYLLARAQGIVLGQVFMGLGHPQLHRRFVVLRVVVLLAGIYPAVIYWGLSGAGAILALSSFIALGMQVIWVGRLINLRFRKYALDWLRGLLLSMLVFIPLGLLIFLKIGGDIFHLVVGIVLYLAAMVIVLFLSRDYLRGHEQMGQYERGAKAESVCEMEIPSV